MKRRVPLLTALRLIFATKGVEKANVERVEIYHVSSRALAHARTISVAPSAVKKHLRTVTISGPAAPAGLGATSQAGSISRLRSLPHRCVWKGRLER